MLQRLSVAIVAAVFMTGCGDSGSSSGASSGGSAPTLNSLGAASEDRNASLNAAPEAAPVASGDEMASSEVGIENLFEDVDPALVADNTSAAPANPPSTPAKSPDSMTATEKLAGLADGTYSFPPEVEDQAHERYLLEEQAAQEQEMAMSQGGVSPSAAPASSAASENSGGGIGNFLSGFFGGGNSAPSAQPADGMTPSANSASFEDLLGSDFDPASMDTDPAASAPGSGFDTFDPAADTVNFGGQPGYDGHAGGSQGSGARENDPGSSAYVVRQFLTAFEAEDFDSAKSSISSNAEGLLRGIRQNELKDVQKERLRKSLDSIEIVAVRKMQGNKEAVVVKNASGKRGNFVTANQLVINRETRERTRERVIENMNLPQ